MRVVGLEPTASSLSVTCSNHLSYTRITPSFLYQKNRRFANKLGGFFDNTFSVVPFANPDKVGIEHPDEIGTTLVSS